jgi:hypothetical protein
VLDRISAIQPPTRVASQQRTPAIKSSNCVLSPRLFHKLKSRRWLRERLATGFELSRGGPAKEIEPSGAGEKLILSIGRDASVSALSEPEMAAGIERCN